MALVVCFALFIVLAATAVQVAVSPDPAARHHPFKTLVHTALGAVRSMTHHSGAALAVSPSAQPGSAPQSKGFLESFLDKLMNGARRITLHGGDDHPKSSSAFASVGGRTSAKRNRIGPSGITADAFRLAVLSRARQRVAAAGGAPVLTAGPATADAPNAMEPGTTGMEADSAKAGTDGTTTEEVGTAAEEDEDGNEAQTGRYGEYPFADSFNPATEVAPDKAPNIFIEPVVVSLEGNPAVKISLGGLYGDVLALFAVAEDGTPTWQLVRTDDGSPLVINGDILLLDTLDDGVYSTTICSDQGCSVPLYLAKPFNTAVADNHLPTGNLHAELVSDSSGGAKLNITGTAYDAIQAALGKGNAGIGEVYLLVDGRKVAVTLDKDGRFSVSVPVTDNEYGIHDVKLYAADAVHKNAMPVDADFISQYSKQFGSVPNANPANWDSWRIGSSAAIWVYGAVNDNGGPSTTPDPYADYRQDAFAKGTAELDANNQLVLTASDTADKAAKHIWVIKDAVTGREFVKEGRTVSTEDLPAGLYDITLRVPTIVNQQYSYSEDQFDMIIPPRMDMSAEKAVGTVHSRWLSAQQDGNYSWTLQVAGRLFDEIGTAVFGYSAADYQAWIQVNGSKIPVQLDSAGNFATSVGIGGTLSPTYDISLHVSGPRIGTVKADSMHQEYINVFSPPTVK